MPRAGTRGFRAPEILFRSAKQSQGEAIGSKDSLTQHHPAIDIWSAGVIMLSLLSGRYPFFESNDDMLSIAELVAVFGGAEMERAAKALGMELLLDAHQRASEPIALSALCAQLSATSRNPHLRTDMPESAYALLSQCLALDPSKRITAAEAMAHDFFK